MEAPKGVQSLAPYGINLEMAQLTLWWLGTRPWTVLPHSISTAGVDAVVTKLVSRRRGAQEMATVSSMTSIINPPLKNEMEDDEVIEETVVSLWRPGTTVSHMVTEPMEWSTPAAVTVVSVVDHTNQESVCTALLVRELLKKFFPFTGPGHVLGPDENLPANATCLLVMSSNGCFQRQSFVRQLFQAERLGIGAIPIIVDGSFQFPSDAFFQQLRTVSPYTLSGIGRGVDDLIALIKQLFEEIGICVRPQDSQAVLEVCQCDLRTEVPKVDGRLCCRALHCLWPI